MSAAPAPAENKALNEILARVDQLAVLPHVVFKVLEISGDADAPASEMEKAITVDPGFSTKVLSMANSAMYALPKKVSSIKEAVMFLGFRTVRTMAMTVGVFDLFVGKTDAESLRRRTWWRHSVDTAVAARWLAEETRKVPADEAYTCGLLHYIGKTLLDRFGAGDYDSVARSVAKGNLEDLAERETFGCDHVDVAIGSARQWEFPDDLVCGLDYLERSRTGMPKSERRALTAMASHIATRATQGQRDQAKDEAPAAWIVSNLGLDLSRLEPIVKQATASIAEARTNLA